LTTLYWFLDRLERPKVFSAKISADISAENLATNEISAMLAKTEKWQTPVFEVRRIKMLRKVVETVYLDHFKTSKVQKTPSKTHHKHSSRFVLTDLKTVLLQFSALLFWKIFSLL
jgi:hypothetical protein